MGLYTPTILGGNSYLSWFYDRGAIKDPAHTGTSKGLSQAINGGPVRKFLPKYANVYVTIQSHVLSADVRPHYVTANGVRNGLVSSMKYCMLLVFRLEYFYIVCKVQGRLFRWLKTCYYKKNNVLSLLTS